ncbi:RING-H2 finger protein ATL16-like [Henckelia pumila]|uniref:RING-H2 finger protein ATL16-like n=1 Tax=Henckelia pumila TaxID=405737 RepID=UPI003C6EA24E
METTPSLHPSHPGFPIIAVAIIGILATAFLLVSYYIFVIKCCLNWHRIDLLARFSVSRRRPVEDPSMVYSALAENRGLDQAAIRSIPIFQFKKTGHDTKERSKSFECAVCLNEFQEREKLRIIPNCGHLFHIDCIDVWLQNNANCPLCRSSISATTNPADIMNYQVIPAPNPARDPINPYASDSLFRDEDYVVIEIGSTLSSATTPLQYFSSGEFLSIIPSPRKIEPGILLKKSSKRFSYVSSMGDECIDNRKKDEQFAVQPIRRSFSMDSADDRQLYLAVQEILIIQQQTQVNGEVNHCIEGCSSSSNNRVKRSFFSFRHGRSTWRNAVQPLTSESQA